jgi:hypothetical protein
LGAVTGVGHARLIIERFGKFWGAFSVGDLFILNFLTIVTEFIGVSLALGYFGVSKYIAVPIAAAALIAMTATGIFRRWERFMYVFVITNFIAIPLAILSHPHVGSVVSHAVTPGVAGGFNSLRCCSRYEAPRPVRRRRHRGDRAQAHARTCGRGPIRARAAERRDHRRGRGHTRELVRLRRRVRPPSLAASRVEQGEGVPRQLRRNGRRLRRDSADPRRSAGITTVVQALAGVLLPSATMFLLLLCNDKAVLGPWTNPTWLNALASVIIGVLVILSAILTATVLFPSVNVTLLTVILAGALAVGLMGAGIHVNRGRKRAAPAVTPDAIPRNQWTMPPLELLERPPWSRVRTVGMYTLRGYLVIAVLMVIVKGIEVGIGR